MYELIPEEQEEIKIEKTVYNNDLIDNLNTNEIDILINKQKQNIEQKEEKGRHG